MSSDEKKPKGMTRRDFFKGAAVAGATVAGVGSLAKYAKAGGKKYRRRPKYHYPWDRACGGFSLDELHEAGEDLERMLLLRSSPIGIMMLVHDIGADRDMDRDRYTGSVCRRDYAGVPVGGITGGQLPAEGLTQAYVLLEGVACREAEEL